MNPILKSGASSRVFLLLAVMATGCKKDEPANFYAETGPQSPTFLGNVFNTATKYTTGEVVTFELQFAQQTDPIKQVVILEKLEPARDSMVLQIIPYAPAFSRIRRVDTLLVRYTVPAGTNKALVRVDARLESTNGQTKIRTFYYRLAEATPIIILNSGPTNVTVPAGTAPAPGDIVRYNLTLNAGGISTAPMPPSTAGVPAGTLYKDLDSLVVFARVGTAPERRVIRLKPAASGAQLIQNVDVPLPAGSAGQPVVLRFEAKARTPARTATATAASITPVAPTLFSATVRTAALSFTGAAGGDFAAYDLTTFSTVPAGGPIISKDIALTSTFGNAVQLRVLNPTAATATRLVRATTAATFTTATLTSIRQAYNAAAATAQVTTLDNLLVGDIIIARLRGLDQYAVLQVTSITRTSATDAAVNFSIKAL